MGVWSDKINRGGEERKGKCGYHFCILENQESIFKYFRRYK